MKKIILLVAFVAFIAIAAIAVVNMRSGNDFGDAKTNYTTHCASCHGQELQAFVDREWINGNS